MVTILAVMKRETNVSKITALQASLDCIHFLLCSYEIFANYGMINLSRDIWRTSDPREAMVFEWMHHNKATSEETTTLSIFDVKEKIEKTFGVQDRQARSIFGSLVERGLVGRKQDGRDSSKTWLDFTPELEGGVELSNPDPINLNTFISNKLEEISRLSTSKGGSGGNDLNDTLERTHGAKTSKNSSSYDNNNLKDMQQTSILATLEPKFIKSLKKAKVTTRSALATQLHAAQQDINMLITKYEAAGRLDTGTDNQTITWIEGDNFEG